MLIQSRNILETAALVGLLTATSACALPAPVSTATATLPTTTPEALPTTVIIQPTATLVLPPTSATGPAMQECTPLVTANTMINVRNGPGTNYSVMGTLTERQVATVDGKNVEGTWWYIAFAASPDGHGWVAASVTTSNCIPDSLAVIPASSLPTQSVAAINDVVVSVDPAEVSVPGCAGDKPHMTATATIRASGPMQVQYYFEIDGVGTAKSSTLAFAAYGSQNVSQKFRPEIVKGKHTVRLWIEGLDVTQWQDSATYTITCP